MFETNACAQEFFLAAISILYDYPRVSHHLDSFLLETDRRLPYEHLYEELEVENHIDPIELRPFDRLNLRELVQLGYTKRAAFLQIRRLDIVMPDFVDNSHRMRLLPGYSQTPIIHPQAVCVLPDESLQQISRPEEDTITMYTGWVPRDTNTSMSMPLLEILTISSHTSGPIPHQPKISRCDFVNSLLEISRPPYLCQSTYGLQPAMNRDRPSPQQPTVYLHTHAFDDPLHIIPGATTYIYVHAIAHYPPLSRSESRLEITDWLRFKTIFDFSNSTACFRQDVRFKERGLDYDLAHQTRRFVSGMAFSDVPGESKDSADAQTLQAEDASQMTELLQSAYYRDWDSFIHQYSKLHPPELLRFRVKVMDPVEMPPCPGCGSRISDVFLASQCESPAK